MTCTKGAALRNMRPKLHPGDSNAHLCRIRSSSRSRRSWRESAPLVSRPRVTGMVKPLCRKRKVRERSSPSQQGIRPTSLPALNRGVKVAESRPSPQIPASLGLSVGDEDISYHVWTSEGSRRWNARNFAGRLKPSLLVFAIVFHISETVKPCVKYFQLFG